MPPKRPPMTENKYVFYYPRPIAFAEQQILRLTPNEVRENKIGRRLEWQTKIILKSVAEHDYVSIASGRGVTKTTSLAFLAIWWLWSRNDSRVMATGPKYDNLKATLWAEIAKWLDKSNVSDEIKLTGERIYHVDKDMHAFGQMMTTKDKENISGIHATHVLWLVDEASNMEREIIDAIIGGMSDPDSKIVMTGNMTKTSGPFYDSHYKDKNWFTIRLSSENSERKNKVWFERMQRFPRESDMYRVNVLGLPPLGNPMAIISQSDCFAARDREVVAGDYLEMGVDPAREGNDLTAIAIRQGMKLLEVRVFPKTKNYETIAHILKMLREYRAKTGIQSKVRIKIDDHGLGGPVCDDLSLNESDNIEVVPCLSNTKIDDDRYPNSGTEMWFYMADIIGDIELCNDEDLLEELYTREWHPGGTIGKMQVEPKDKQKERIGRSPDRADATIICFYKGSKKVFERPDNKSISSDFTIDWNYDHLTDPGFTGIFLIDVLHYAALVLNKDLSINGIAAIYQQYRDKLWIYAEFKQEHPDPDIIARIVKKSTRKGLYDDDRDVRIIGDAEMFNTNQDRQPLGEILLRSGLYISPAEKYDEFGAIALGIRMYGENDIIIHENLKDIRTAVALWSVKKGGPDVDNNGFVKALLLILSEVRRRKKEKKVMKGPKDYSPIFKKKEESRKMTAWCKR